MPKTISYKPLPSLHISSRRKYRPPKSLTADFLYPTLRRLKVMGQGHTTIHNSLIAKADRNRSICFRYEVVRLRNLPTTSVPNLTKARGVGIGRDSAHAVVIFRPSQLFPPGCTPPGSPTIDQYPNLQHPYSFLRIILLAAQRYSSIPVHLWRNAEMGYVLHMEEVGANIGRRENRRKNRRSALSSGLVLLYSATNAFHNGRQTRRPRKRSGKQTAGREERSRRLT